MPILRALSGRSHPASAAQVARVTGSGTPAGIRRALERLALHGICHREELGGRALFSLNYHHVLYPAARAALDADEQFKSRLRRELEQWEPRLVSAVLFGSAARGDGGTASDIDLLLIRPDMTARDREHRWNHQVHDLRGQVFAWTGNRLQVIDWTSAAFRRYAMRGELLIGEILRDGITLVGAQPSELMEAHRQRTSGQGRRG